jgi:diaminohydroxyphosphoribosylaminopyrimidine deaminase/5-amino-6-(5-phosphoribosylamino)uracil reductase
MTPDLDITMMRRAIELAMRGRGGVEPNPMVGCVIVKGGRVIGQGWHRHYGGPHAEVEALAACRESPEGATAYVTLEPCCHTNKQTPPCVPQLIAAKLGRVVAGCVDPNPAVSGRGMDQLRQAGIAADVSSLEAECRQLIAPFTARLVLHRPYVTLKGAQTADGKVAGRGGRRMRISNDASMERVHGLRSRSDAILVGGHTAVNDDPLLTARPRRGKIKSRRLIRVILDTPLRLAAASRLVATAREVPTWVYCSIEAGESQRATELVEKGVILKPVLPVERRIALAPVLSDLASAGVTHLIVEPGPTLAHSFIERNLADRAWVFHSPVLVGDVEAPSAPALDWTASAQIELDGDWLLEFLNPQSPAFFNLDMSADAVIASGTD